MARAESQFDQLGNGAAGEMVGHRKYRLETAACPAWSGATPIIWGDHVFLNVAEGGKLYLWCVDRRGPKVAWKKFLGDGDHKERKQNMSSPSPVTDGKNVWVMTGTGSLKAFDFEGNELWSRNIQKDYGRFGFNWGYASSPLLHGRTRCSCRCCTG